MSVLARKREEASGKTSLERFGGTGIPAGSGAFPRCSSE